MFTPELITVIFFAAGFVGYSLLKPFRKEEVLTPVAEMQVEEEPVLISEQYIEELERKALAALRTSGLSMKDEPDALIALREIGHKVYSPKTYIKTIETLIEQNPTSDSEK